MSEELQLLLPQQTPQAVFRSGPFAIYLMTALVDDIQCEAVAVMIPAQGVQHVIVEVQGKGIVAARFAMEQRKVEGGKPEWRAVRLLGAEFFESQDAAVTAAMRESASDSIIH